MNAGFMFVFSKISPACQEPRGKMEKNRFNRFQFSAHLPFVERPIQALLAKADMRAINDDTAGPACEQLKLFQNKISAPNASSTAKRKDKNLRDQPIYSSTLQASCGRHIARSNLQTFPVAKKNRPCHNHIATRARG